LLKGPLAKELEEGRSQEEGGEMGRRKEKEAA